MGLLWFLLLWGLIGYFAYTKWQSMRNFERTATIATMKQPKFIFSFGFLLVGFFLSSVAGLLGSYVVNLGGTAMMLIGAVTLAVLNWKTNRPFSYFLLACVALISFVNVFG